MFRPVAAKIVQGLKSTCKRHGTVNFFAALEVATGVIRGKTTQTKKRVYFQTFMSEIIEDQPSDHQIHFILDNYCAHKKNETWLAAHPNVTFHFTPTSASSLNRSRSGSASSPERRCPARAFAVPSS